MSRIIVHACEQCGHQNVIDVDAASAKLPMSTPLDDGPDNVVQLRGDPRPLPMSIPLDDDEYVDD